MAQIVAFALPLIGGVFVIYLLFRWLLGTIGRR